MPLITHSDAPAHAPPSALLHSKLAAAVAIPAQNEDERIGACLAALAAQTTTEPFAIVVLANNCTDATAARVRAFALQSPLAVHLYEVDFPVGEGNAGKARRTAMNAACALLGEHGALLTTDADSRVNPDWVERNLADLREVDLVCGLVTPDQDEGAALPFHVMQRGALEFVYQNMLCELETRLDPLPYDPGPRHLMETGASLGVDASWYRRMDGMPPIQPAEDRAFVARVRRAGGRIRHSLSAHVVTSCRLDGRARGGWSDDLAARVTDPMAPCHEVLEDATSAFRRLHLRAALRECWGDVDVGRWARRLKVPLAQLRAMLRERPFEEAWARVEEASPALARERMRPETLAEQVQIMSRYLERVKRIEAKRAQGEAELSEPAQALQA
jgi:glycosyltransferase involved in cell wall biosynthesis